MDLSATLSQLAADPFQPVDLAAVALHLAADEFPTLDVPAYLTRLDEYGEAVASRMGRKDTLEARVTELSEFLFEEEGFLGNASQYYDPRNSYLHEVLDRKLGIPITLSVLAIAVGERAGLTVHGVGLPGHFVAKAIDDEEEVIFDPFHGGQLLDPDACEQLVSTITGQVFTATDETLAAAPPGFVVMRMLNNLKGIYLREKDFPRSARVIERLVQLNPTDPHQRRDLGVCLLHAGQPGKAVDHLHAYIAATPSAADAKAVADFLKEARKQVAQLN